ncbi:rhamnogalacturonan lyase family protein [Streptomyces sp. NPDC001157]
MAWAVRATEIVRSGTPDTVPACGTCWREEAVRPTADDTALRIYSTPYETSTRITTLAEHRLQPASAPELLHQ